VRNSVDGERELVMARWGIPGPPQFGGQPVTNNPQRREPTGAATGAAYAFFGPADKTLIDVKSGWAMPTIGQSLRRSRRRQPETASGRVGSEMRA
jgi:hypothetical protein